MKKVLLGITILIIAVGIVISFWSPKEIGGSTSVPQDPVQYIERLERYLVDESKEGERGLLELATDREDAIGYQANLALARRLALAGQDATAYYAMALELYNTKEVRYELAENLKERGETPAAIEEYLKLLPDQEALESLVELEADRLIIADGLINTRNWSRAEEYIHSQLDIADGDIQLALQKRYARVLGERGKFSQALTVLAAIQKQGELNPQLKWWYGRSLESTGKASQAIEIYQQLGEVGAYRLGILLEQGGKIEEAATAFTQSTQPISLWRGARIWDNLEQKEKALEAYRLLTKEEGTYQDDAAYRLYILSDDQGEKARMLEILAPYPAWMARLGQESNLHLAEDIEVEKPEFLRMVDLFKSLNLEELAKIELAIGEQRADLSSMLALGDWYYDQGDYFRSVRWGIRALREQPSKKAYQLAYPRPYGDYVFKFAENYEVDPHLIWAVMREESHFRADVFSVAGARGVMQIMPATGRDIANRLKTEFKEEDLLNPEVNIRFGAFYIRNMLNMFGDDVDKALAAYNGGSGNVRRWGNTPLGSTPEGFPTAITFVETRNYITKVLNSYHIYNWLYQ